MFGSPLQMTWLPRVPRVHCLAPDSVFDVPCQLCTAGTLPSWLCLPFTGWSDSDNSLFSRAATPLIRLCVCVPSAPPLTRAFPSFCSLSKYRHSPRPFSWVLFDGPLLEPLSPGFPQPVVGTIPVSLITFLLV